MATCWLAAAQRAIVCGGESLSRAAEMNWSVCACEAGDPTRPDPTDWGITRARSGWDGVVRIYDWGVMDGPNFTGQVDNTWDKNLQAGGHWDR